MFLVDKMIFPNKMKKSGKIKKNPKLSKLFFTNFQPSDRCSSKVACRIMFSNYNNKTYDDEKKKSERILPAESCNNKTFQREREREEILRDILCILLSCIGVLCKHERKA